MSTPLNDAALVGRATRIPRRPEAVSTRLRGRGLIFARAAWLTTVSLIAALFLARLPAYYRALQTVCNFPACGYVQPTLETAHTLRQLGLSVGAYADLTLALELALALLCFALGGVIFWRRSDDWLALLGALAVVASVALNGNLFSMDMSSALGWIAMGLYAFAGGLYLLILSLSDGRFVTRWAPLVLLCWGVAVIQFFFYMNSFYSVVWFLALVSLVIAQSIYYRTAASPLQRERNKWFILGGCVEGLISVVTLVPLLIFPALGQNGSLYQLVNALALILLSFVFPICIGMGILRSRLYDIEIILRRTLVYGILTVCVVGVYVLVVGVLGALAGTTGNLLISLVAAALVAVLFQPLRERLQRGVNHLLYGQRDEPYAVVTQLSQRLETTLAPEAALATVVDTVAQALKLPYTAILLKQGDTFQLAASAGERVAEPLILPLVYQAETSGQLHLAPRAPGESFTPADRRLLEELARQAGLAAHAVRLAEDLRRSYEFLEQRVADRTHELTTLLDISHTVASTLELNPLLRLILDQLKLVIEYTGSSILTLDDDRLVFLDHRGPVPQVQLERLSFPLRQLGPVWQVIAASEPVCIPNIDDDTQLAQALRAAMGDLRTTTFAYVHSWMAVPLRLRDQVHGMLAIASDKEDAFTPHHATLAQAVANQAAVAIENARLYEQAQDLAAVEERQRLARELHDSVSQALYGIALGLHTARIQLDRDPQELPESIDYLLSLADGALDEMRSLIFELRPESLESEGLVAALARQGAALHARHNLMVVMDFCDEPTLSLTAKQELYRVAQEALHNIAKHAHSHNVDLILRQASAAVELEIHDDGIGFDPEGSFPGHLGLRSMRERVANLGGAIDIDSAPERGTRMTARIPTEQVHDTKKVMR